MGKMKSEMGGLRGNLTENFSNIYTENSKIFTYFVLTTYFW